MLSLSVTVEVPFLEIGREVELGESIHNAYVCVDVCVFTYSSLDFGVGWHERMGLLHYVAGEVANAGILLSIIGVLYLQTHDIDKSY